MRRKRRFGVALFIVLLTTLMLTMMVGAFFGVNQSNFAILGSTFRRKEALLAAETGLNYVRFQLEKDQTWGVTEIPGFRERLGGLCVISAPGGGTTVRGEFSDGRVFEAEIQNRLAQPASALVPADAVRVVCKGSSGGFRTTLAVVFKGEPIYDAAASTNGKIDMTENTNWEIHSKDPIRNWVRSNDEIYTPDVLNDPTNHRMKFISDVSSPVSGVLWSRKDIYSGMSERVEGVRLGEMSSNIKGVLAPRSTVNNNLYDLQLSDLKVPDNTTIVNVPPGRYVVTEATAVPINREGFIFTRDVDQPPVPIRTLTYYPAGGGTPTVYYPQSELIRVRGSAGVHPPTNGTEVSGNVVNPGGIPGFTYNFDTEKFEFSGSKQYKVDGDFATGYEAPSGGRGMVEVNPDIIFSSGSSSGPPTFVNVTGNFDVTGTVTGRGAVATTGDIRMKAEANLAASTSDPLVLYSAGSVNIDASGKDNIRFTGLVYAQNQFNVTSSTRISSVNITGSLVARNGGIKMNLADSVFLTYDQAYLEQLTKGLPNGRRRLKQMSWHVE
ncbi:MAG: hypothetical protein KF760_22565 [Candidatus Eremiobacteraeota bacterium]|nr:hypothetical protein [Candidatus Eremiobacteraeota bacterium]MCW5868584.1 hypothetical protein [Candidatus Eremiobacteraeota bacterium]